MPPTMPSKRPRRAPKMSLKHVYATAEEVAEWRSKL